MDTITACVCCHRTLRDGETLGCRICQREGVQRLRALPGLYAASAAHLAPGRSASGTGRVSGSKSAPLPVRADVLDARGPGGVVWVVTQWEEIVRSELGFGEVPFRGDYQASITGSTQFLVSNVVWLYAQFRAVEELHGELRAWHGRLTALISGADRERQLTLMCGCGEALPGVTLSTPGRRCASCGQQYGWAELRQLHLAARSAA